MHKFQRSINTMRIQKSSFITLFPVMFLAFVVTPAQALDTSGLCVYPPSPTTLYMNSEFTAQRDIPVGGVIGSVNYSSQQLKLTESCTGGYRGRAVILSTFPSVSNTLFASGVPGVALRVTMNDQIIPNTMTFFVDKVGDGSGPVYLQSMKVELVKTGDITPGKMNTGELAVVQLTDSQNGLKRVLGLNVGSVLVKQSSCEITGSSAIPVNMGKADANDFHGKNSTLSPVNIQIPLQCDSGAKVNISFAATSSQGNGIIDLTSGGAEGVGILLKLHDTPVDFDQTLFVAQATEQGAFTIPLTASYIQSGESIKPGAANAVANFTVTYQ